MKKIAFFTAGLVVLLLSFIFADRIKSAEDNSWIRAIGGSGKDYATTINLIGDEIVIAGFTASTRMGDEDIFLMGLNQKGETRWSRIIGGEGEEKAFSVEPTSDGGLIVAGSTDSFGAGGVDLFVIKLRPDRSLEWAKAIGGEWHDTGLYAIETRDKGFLAVGTTQSFGKGSTDGILVKLNHSGELVWARSIGGEGGDTLSGIQKTQDGGYALAGRSNSFGKRGMDIWVVKLNGEESFEWGRVIGGNRDESSSWCALRQTRDGGYIIAGKTSSYGAGNRDFFIVKLKKDGSFEWSKVIGGKGYDAAWAVIEVTNGGYIAAGTTSPLPREEEMRRKRGGRRPEKGHPPEGIKLKKSVPDIDVLVVRFDSEGNVMWMKTIGGKKNGLEEVEEIIEVKDGFVLAGITHAFGTGRGDAMIIKLNREGLIPGCPIIKDAKMNIQSQDIFTPSIKPYISRINPFFVSVQPRIETPEFKVEKIFSVGE